MIIAILAATLLGAAPATPAPTETFGDCVWSNVAGADKADIAAAYQKAWQAGFAAHAHDIDPTVAAKMPALRAAFAQCDAAPGLPPALVDALVQVESQRFGAAVLLADSPHISQARLDAAWAEAPDTVRACVLADVQDFYGVSAFTCQDHVVANRWFLTHLGLDPLTGNRDAAAMVIYYEHGVAESGLAAEVIQAIEKDQAAHNPS